ncbi:hypothetical protein [Flavobacterium cerinum]|uniref:Uncharacterized protein n=1 Tax=Flavobacterium cerinum TaxID=2502784 RepID=A0ABY5ITT6_9FLAO|nr:hypothetical protein [Flavobacterium cerinum]UUC45577.1 hypothetical protein NOX80_18395 [Flavobacterium cerinum]
MGQDRQAALNRAIAVAQSKGIDVRNARFTDKTMYFVFDAKGKSNILELIDADTKKIEGTTNFDGNTLNKGRYLVIDSLRVLGEDTATEFGKAKWKSELDPVSKNSELRIHQDGILVDMPVTDFHNEGQSSSNDDDFRDIVTAPIIMPETVYGFTWNFPKGQTVSNTLTSALIRIEARCIQIFTS